VVLTSSRARADETVDELSDCDVVLAVEDAAAFAERDDWIRAVGEPLARWGDEGEVHGVHTSFRGVVYEDGVKIDFSIWPAELIGRIGLATTLPDNLDVGFRVLLDKDGATRGWPAPTYRAHIPGPPTEAEYRALVEEFFWTATYVAKALWRGDLVFAKFCLDHDLKLVALRRMLEWSIELARGWSVRPGVLGRGLERLLPRDVRSELEATYVGAGTDENWDALFATIALFRRIAVEVGEGLGFAYPHDVDAGITTQLRARRAAPPPAPPAS
jgi:aminoglycoside 6-adenylyltransferase